jgi:Family of unknown function (DUF5684)
MIGLVLVFGIMIFLFASIWKLFTKAGEPGWASLVPIYNIITLLKIAGQPLWMIILFLLPLANIYALIVTWHGVSKRFGKDGGFTAGLILLGIVFIPILAWGDAKYQGVSGQPSDPNILDS